MPRFLRLPYWWKRIPTSKGSIYADGRCKECGGMLMVDWHEVDDNGEAEIWCMNCGTEYRERDFDYGICRTCGARILESNGYCESCGIQWHCKGCGRYVEDGSGVCDDCRERGFCSHCGSLLTPEGYCPHHCEDSDEGYVEGAYGDLPDQELSLEEGQDEEKRDSEEKDDSHVPFYTDLWPSEHVRHCYVCGSELDGEGNCPQCNKDEEEDNPWWMRRAWR